MSVYDYSARTIDGTEQCSRPTAGRRCWSSMSPANAASRRNTRGWRRCIAQFRERGFEVLGFPCDQFGHQEPGDEAEIAASAR